MQKNSGDVENSGDPMRYFPLVIVSVVWFSSILAVYQVKAATEFHEVASSSGTVGTVNLVQATATNMTSSSPNGTLAGAFAIEIYNTDSTKTINCGFSDTVSTQTSRTLYGREILPKTGYTFQVNPSAISLFCMTQNTTASSTATVTQVK